MGIGGMAAEFPGPDWTPSTTEPMDASVQIGASAVVSFMEEKIYGNTQSHDEIG